MTPDLTGSFAEVPGGKLWTEQAGTGPAVLFAHAGIADRRMWDHQMTALAGRYHVIRYHQRGFGRSSPPATPFSHVADFGAVLDHADARKAVLVGSSVGGATVIDYALAHPGRVTGLVPVASGISGDFPWQPWAAEFDAAVKSGDPDAAMRTALSLVLPLRTDPDVDARIRELLADSLPGLAALGTQWADWAPAYGRLDKIKVPALVVAGDRDQDDFLRIARLLASQITGTRLVILPGTDHNVPVRAAAAFTRLLRDFLDRLPAPGKPLAASVQRAESDACHGRVFADMRGVRAKRARLVRIALPGSGWGTSRAPYPSPASLAGSCDHPDGRRPQRHGPAAAALTQFLEPALTAMRQA